LLISLLTSSFLQEKDPSRKEKVKAELLGYVRGTENKRDRDPEIYFVVGTAKRALGEDMGSCESMDRALHYHPSSAFYAHSAAACYAGYGRMREAQAVARSIEIYYDNYRNWRYPDGVMVHRTKDLEAEIELANGNRERALKLMRQNLESANNDQFVINDWRARQSLSKEALVGQLEQKVRLLQAKITQDGHKTTRTIAH